MTAAHRSMQVAELLRHVDDARQARQRECVRLLSELTPQLQKAVAAERQRERPRAPQFNVFKYLREDELGLSRIIADLLNPTAAHGQGTRFLEEMLDVLPETRGRFGTLRPTTPIRVATERWYWGVQSPKRKSKMTGAERERHEELRTALGDHGLSLAHGAGDWWSQWEWLPRYKDWDPLVPDLHDECEAGGGPITDCYVDGLLGIAALAIPAINEVEKNGRTTPSE